MRKTAIALICLLFLVGCATAEKVAQPKMGSDQYGEYAYEGEFDPQIFKTFTPIQAGSYGMQIIVVVKCPKESIDYIVFFINSPLLIKSNPDCEHEIQCYGYIDNGEVFDYGWIAAEKTYKRILHTEEEDQAIRNFFKRYEKPSKNINVVI